MHAEKYGMDPSRLESVTSSIEPLTPNKVTSTGISDHGNIQTKRHINNSR
jgi:hypothetical protein